MAAFMVAYGAPPRDRGVQRAYVSTWVGAGRRAPRWDLRHPPPPGAPSPAYRLRLPLAKTKTRWRLRSLRPGRRLALVAACSCWRRPGSRRRSGRGVGSGHEADGRRGRAVAPAAAAPRSRRAPVPLGDAAGFAAGVRQYTWVVSLPTKRMPTGQPLQAVRIGALFSSSARLTSSRRTNHQTPRWDTRWQGISTARGVRSAVPTAAPPAESDSRPIQRRCGPPGGISSAWQDRCSNTVSGRGRTGPPRLRQPVRVAIAPCKPCGGSRTYRTSAETGGTTSRTRRRRPPRAQRRPRGGCRRRRRSWGTRLAREASSPRARQHRRQEGRRRPPRASSAALLHVAPSSHPSLPYAAPCPFRLSFIWPPRLFVPPRLTAPRTRDARSTSPSGRLASARPPLIAQVSTGAAPRRRVRQGHPSSSAASSPAPPSAGGGLRFPPLSVACSRPVRGASRGTLDALEAGGCAPDEGDSVTRSLARFRTRSGRRRRLVGAHEASCATSSRPPGCPSSERDG